MKKQFHFGFWNYPAASQTKIEAVDDWQDLGMNLTLSPRYDAACEKQHFLDILDKGHEYGIKFVLNDGRANWNRLTSDGEEAYRRGIAEMLADFGSHPAAWGYYVGDEPRHEQLAVASRACAIGKEVAPHLIAFLNLLPGWDGLDEYLDTLATEAGIQLFSYDCYTQMNPGKDGWWQHFQSLKHYSDASRRHNIPFWSTMLAIGHFNYRTPNLDDFRWQLNTAAACGAKGVWWFYLYKNDFGFSNYRRAAISFGRRTQTYEDLWEAQTTFKNFFADTLANLTLEKAEFTLETYGGFPFFDGEGIIAHPEGKDTRYYKEAMIFSHFKSDDGQRYIMVTNNSCERSIRPTIYLKGEGRRIFLYFYGNVERELKKGTKLHDNGMYESKDGLTQITMWLAPGQAFFFRWE